VRVNDVRAFVDRLEDLANKSTPLLLRRQSARGIFVLSRPLLPGLSAGRQGGVTWTAAVAG
jgi:hypothetical protein